jgi:hypothetical protein
VSAVPSLLAPSPLPASVVIREASSALLHGAGLQRGAGVRRRRRARGQWGLVPWLRPPVQNGGGGSDEHPDAAGGGRLSGAAGERCTGTGRSLAPFGAGGPEGLGCGSERLASPLRRVVGGAESVPRALPTPPALPMRAPKGGRCGPKSHERGLLAAPRLSSPERSRLRRRSPARVSAGTFSRGRSRRARPAGRGQWESQAGQLGHLLSLSTMSSWNPPTPAPNRGCSHG